jgi:hypothetical protein
VDDFELEAPEPTFYITTMTHMEGDFKDDEIEALFNKHVEDMTWAMDLFDEYGAKLTFESEQPFAKACSKWGVNILKEVVERGHGVGTHADFGAGKKAMSMDEFIAAFEENKKLVDDLVGAENNKGVSGGTGPTDWVLASAAAGFDFRDGITGFGYLSMDESERPEGWTDEYIRDITYHDPIPVDFEERIYSLLLKDATDLEEDEDGIMVIMGGDIGELASLAEGRKECFPDCEFNSEDVAAYQASLDEALSLWDHERVARINIHIPAKLLTEQYEDTLRELLETIQAYVDRGEVEWATQLESYEGYKEYN